jgi:predicted methyltransferase
VIWTHNPDGTLTDKSAIEYLIGGGFLYHRQDIYWTADAEVVSAKLVERLTDAGLIARDESPIQLTEKGRRELRVPR